MYNVITSGSSRFYRNRPQGVSREMAQATVPTSRPFGRDVLRFGGAVRVLFGTAIIDAEQRDIIFVPPKDATSILKAAWHERRTFGRNRTRRREVRIFRQLTRIAHSAEAPENLRDLQAPYASTRSMACKAGRHRFRRSVFRQSRDAIFAGIENYVSACSRTPARIRLDAKTEHPDL
jgi:hypothetical protein